MMHGRRNIKLYQCFKRQLKTPTCFRSFMIHPQGVLNVLDWNYLWYFVYVVGVWQRDFFGPVVCVAGATSHTRHTQWLTWFVCLTEQVREIMLYQLKQHHKIIISFSMTLCLFSLTQTAYIYVYRFLHYCCYYWQCLTNWTIYIDPCSNVMLYTLQDQYWHVRGICYLPATG